MSVPGREMRPHLHSAKGQSLLLQLPPELLGHIFSYLPVADKAQVPGQLPSRRLNLPASLSAHP